MKKATVIVVLLGLLLVGSGCKTDQVATNGPFPNAYSLTALCIPKQRAVWVGTTGYPPPTAPITFESVELIAPTNLELVNAWVLPGEGPFLGAANRQDLRANILDYGLQWNNRKVVAGTTVTPEDGEFVFVLRVKRTAEDGDARGLRINYRADGQNYQGEIVQGWAVASTKCGPEFFEWQDDYVVPNPDWEAAFIRDEKEVVS